MPAYYYKKRGFLLAGPLALYVLSVLTTSLALRTVMTISVISAGLGLAVGAATWRQIARRIDRRNVVTMYATDALGYALLVKKQVTIRLGVDVIEYFKKLADETGIPYQNLINLYLRECALAKKKPLLKWASESNQ